MNLKSKKIRLHADIKSLQEFAEEAESTGHIKVKQFEAI